MRSEGRAVKSWWLKGHAKQIIRNMYPDADFKCSDHWLRLFLKRNRLSLQRKTHKAQRFPNDVIEEISKFHRHLMKIWGEGVYQ